MSLRRPRRQEAALTGAIIEPARQYGWHGYRRITALLRAEGWACNHKRVERTWRQEGLKALPRQPRRGRLQANAARPSRANRVTPTARYHAALTFAPDHPMGAGQTQAIESETTQPTRHNGVILEPESSFFAVSSASDQAPRRDRRTRSQP